MFRGPESWDNIACYFRHVIKKKREREVELQQMTNRESSDWRLKKIDP